MNFLWRRWEGSLAILRYGSRAVGLVWHTSHLLTCVMGLCTLIAGILPGVIAYVGKLIVDAVVAAAQSGSWPDQRLALSYVALEAGIVVAAAGSRQGLAVTQSLLRVLLGERVNELILEKALTLELHHFENAEIYDKMTRARQEASSRPLGFVMGLLGLVEKSLSLVTFAGLLISFSGWATGILILASVPPFLVESRFAGEAFLLFRRRTPETRQQRYLEHLIAHEDFAREVKLYQLGSTFLARYRQIFAQLWAEGRNLTLRRGAWSYGLGILSTLTFYGAYSWIIWDTIRGRISLGAMTLYITVFRQGQTTLTSLLSTLNDLYESTLYLATLYEFLEEPISQKHDGVTSGSLPGDGIRFEGVTFVYPGSQKPALKDVWLHLRPGEKLALVGKNGSGKTTLINLLTRMYTPTQGRIRLDGTDLQDWDIQVLHRRIGVIFQNFVRYQFTAGENIGVGDVDYLEDESKWHQAAQKGMAAPIVESMPQRYQTPLGRWLWSGAELSGGQWQKIALSRAFMRQRADILVLDEPTAAMDAEAEVEIFERVRALSPEQMAILISHRFSTVRMADRILVIEHGQIVEQGSHADLLALGGRYAHLFGLQAAGYR